MKTVSKKLAALIALIACIGFLGACNTAEGFGEDLEEAGEEIQEEAD